RGSSVCSLMNNFSFISLVLTDETKPPAVASLSSEETELSEDKDSPKDPKGTWEGDPVHAVGHEQDQAEGQQDDSAEKEMKTGADSQSSYMEIK
ncbi:hypothetical protein N311_04796, partial [Apaloderma vittatum]